MCAITHTNTNAPVTAITTFLPMVDSKKPMRADDGPEIAAAAELIRIGTKAALTTGPFRLADPTLSGDAASIFSVLSCEPQVHTLGGIMLFLNRVQILVLLA